MTGIGHALHALLVALLVSFLAGCSARYISEAQQHFSRGAELENAAIAATVENYRELSRLSEMRARAAQEYRLARGLLMREIRENASDLRDEKLLGTAKALRALAAWRLSELDDEPLSRAELERLAADALNDDAGGVGTRDRVVLRSFPAFADHRAGLAASDPATAQRHFRSALDVYEAALEGVPKDHGVRRYIRLSQAQTLKAWFESDPGSAPAVHRRYKAVACALKPSWSAQAALKQDLTARATNLGYTWQDTHFDGCPSRNRYLDTMPE